MSSGMRPQGPDPMHSSRFTHKRISSLPPSLKSSSQSTAKSFNSAGIEVIYEEQEYQSGGTTTMSRPLSITMPTPLAPPPQGRSYRHSSYQASYVQHEIVPPQYDASQLSTELSHIKHLHAQDIHYFQNEIGHLRRLLASSDRALQETQEAHKNQSVQLERIVRRRDIIIEERNALQTIREGLDSELLGKKEEVRGLVKILAEIDKELEGVAADGRPARWSIAPSTASINSNRLSIISTLTSKPSPAPRTDSDATSTSTLCPPPVPTTLEKYSVLPSRIHTMVQTLEGSDKKFASAYEAWSDSIKHQRRLAQTSSQSLTTQLAQKDERIRELECELRRVGAENAGLNARVGVSEREVGMARRELTEVVRELGEARSRGNGGAGAGLEAGERVDVREVVEGVEQLNERICEASMHLAAIIEPRSGSPSFAAPPPSQEGDQLSTLIRSLPPEDLELNIQTLLQAALASWCARAISSWELSLDQPGSGELLAVYRRMRTVDPTMSAHWRSLTRGQLRFSSTQWTKSLLSALQRLLDGAGMRYAKSEVYVERVVDGLVGATKSLRRAMDAVVILSPHPSSRHSSGWQTADEVPVEVEVFLPAHGMPFDPLSMNDTSGLGVQGEAVLAGVQLGLTLTRAPGQEQEVVCYPGVVTRLRRGGGQGGMGLVDEDNHGEEEEVPPPPISKS